MLSYKELLDNSHELINLYKYIIPSPYYLNKLEYVPMNNDNDNNNNDELVMELSIVLDNKGIETVHKYFISKHGYLLVYSSMIEPTRLVQLWLNNLKPSKTSKIFDSGVIVYVS